MTQPEYPYNVVRLATIAHAVGLITREAKKMEAVDPHDGLFERMVSGVLVELAEERDHPDAMDRWWDLVRDAPDSQIAQVNGVLWLIGEVALIEAGKMTPALKECEVTRELYGYCEPVVDTPATMAQLAARLGIEVAHIPADYHADIESVFEYNHRP